MVFDEKFVERITDHAVVDPLRTSNDNPTIGIILCTEKDETVVKYSVLAGNEKLFASKYRLFLPTEAELIAEIEKKKRLLENQS